MMKKIVVGVVMMGLLSLCIAAPDAEQQKKIDEAIGQLGDSKFRTRKQASQFLWGLMDEALPSLEKAAASDDPEVSIRAKELIEKIESGIGPGMSDELAEQIEIFRSTRSASTKYRIAANLFEDENGTRILYNLLTKEKSEFTRNNVISMILPKLYERVSIAILNDDHKDIPLLLDIDLLSNSDRSYRNVALYAFLRGTIDDDLADLKNINEPSERDLRLQLYMHRAKGDMEATIKVALKLENNELLRAVLTEAGKWDDLAKLFEKRITEDEVEWLGYRASYNRLAGNMDVFNECIQQLVNLGRASEDELEYVVEVLLLNDEYQKATDLLIETRESLDAVKLLEIQMKFTKLLEVIATDPEPADPDYFKLLKKKIQVGAKMNEGEEEYVPREQLRDADSPLARIIDKGLDVAEAGKWERAAATFAEGMKEEPSSPICAYLYGWALQHAGKMEDGQEFMDRATMMPLANEQQRYALVMILDEAAQFSDSAYQRALLLVSGAFESRITSEAIMAFGVANSLYREKFDQAVHYSERSRLLFVSKNSYLVEPHYYMIRAGQIMQIKTLGYHHQGQHDKAAKVARNFAEMLPNSAMEFAVELKDLGAEKAYRSAFDTSYEILSTLCEDYPKAAETHNALAWQTAICRENLEEGLRLAKIATTLIPDSPEYLDTLAEVHFQLKNDTTAIKMMKRCISMDEENEYYTRQLTRFEAGDRESPAE